MKKLPTENEYISSFSFKTGRAIEKLIINEMDNLYGQNQMLEAKILDWWGSHKEDEEFANHFNIISSRGNNEDKTV